MITGWLAAALGVALGATARPLAAADEARAPSPALAAGPGALVETGAQLRQVSAGVYALGKVTLNKQERAVSFPAAVNQREGVVEYAVVTTAGKTHESVFRTPTEPQHIHLAMLLLGAKAANTNAFPADLAAPIPGERVTLEVAWKSHGREVKRPLEEFVVRADTSATLAPGPWVYNGSYLAEGTFVAQLEGSIVSVHIDPNALLNNPRPGRENDELHFVNTKALPPEGVPVQITVRLPPPGTSPRPGVNPTAANPPGTGQATASAGRPD